MGRRRQGAPAPSEKAIQTAILSHWRVLSQPDTLVACLPNAMAHGQPGLTKGLPDLIVLGPGVPGRVGFVELKRDEASTVSAAQHDFAALCNELGVAHAFCVGRDEPIAILEAWDVIRRAAA
jgi:hypothetical protein